MSWSAICKQDLEKKILEAIGSFVFFMALINEASKHDQ
jgi:hypothetical protein